MKIARILLILLSFGLLVLANVRLRSPGDHETVAAQLTYLEGQLGSGAAESMQSQFPEGYVFTWALYGLASAQLADALDGDDERRAHLLAQSARALAAVRSPRGRSTFSAETPLPHGAFYRSWSLYLFAVHLRAAGKASVPASMVDEFTSECEQFAGAIESSETPFLESYPWQAWPADMPPGIAALAIHDALIEPRFESTIRRWVEEVRVRLDRRLGAIAHSVDPMSGHSSGVVRGSSLALISRLLVEIDPALAREQYAILREHFLDDLLGIPGVREYPRGVDGKGDVDSGPIVAGFSGPAIVVGAAAARANGDHDVADGLLGTVELVGVPVEFSGERSYGFGVYPVGDAFIAWARSSTAVDAAIPWDRFSASWFVAFHILSALLAGLLLWWGYLSVRTYSGRSRS